MTRSEYHKREKYGTDEGTRKTVMICIIAVVVLAITVVGIIFSEDIFRIRQTEESVYDHKVQNPDIAKMSVQALEEVANLAKLERDRDDALFLLLKIYRRRTILDLYSFYENHPGNRFTDEALAIVTHKSDSLYEVACKTNTEQGWSDFLVKTPEVLHRDGEERYDEFRWAKTAELWDTEEKAWEQVTLLHSYDTYKRYIKMYPEGEHVKDAKKKLEEIKKKEERKILNKENDRKRYNEWIKRMHKYHMFEK